MEEILHISGGILGIVHSGCGSVALERTCIPHQNDDQQSRAGDTHNGVQKVGALFLGGFLLLLQLALSQSLGPVFLLNLSFLGCTHGLFSPLNRNSRGREGGHRTGKHRLREVPCGNMPYLRIILKRIPGCTGAGMGNRGVLQFIHGNVRKIKKTAAVLPRSRSNVFYLVPPLWPCEPV